jgi:hypothetical protein
MRLRPGDRCANPARRLEAIVNEASREPELQKMSRCACGSPIRKVYSKPAAHKLILRGSRNGTDAARTP